MNNNGSVALAPSHTIKTLSDLEEAGAVTAVALVLPAMDFDRWEAMGRFLGSVNKASRFWIGDWLNHGEQEFGELAAQAADVTGLSPGTLVNYRWVTSRVPPIRRRPELSFGHHDAVASLGPREQRRWLKEALDEGWTRDQLRQRLRDAEALPRAERVALGEAERNATERLAEAVRSAVDAAVRQPGEFGATGWGWWVPDEAWTALVEAA